MLYFMMIKLRSVAYLKDKRKRNYSMWRVRLDRLSKGKGDGRMMPKRGMKANFRVTERLRLGRFKNPRRSKKRTLVSGIIIEKKVEKNVTIWVINESEIDITHFRGS